MQHRIGRKSKRIIVTYIRNLACTPIAQCTNCFTAAPSALLTVQEVAVGNATGRGVANILVHAQVT